MANKNIFVLFGIVFIFLIGNVSAVIINEIMYDPVQDDNFNEWIEIYNDEPNNIDLNGWNLCGKEILAGYVKYNAQPVTNNQGLILPIGSYAIITDGGSGAEVYSNFAVDGSSLALHINAASLCNGALTNSGKTIILENNNNITINSVTYNLSMGANGDGNSLQLCGGVWTDNSPTPGSLNLCSTNQTQTNQTQNQTQATTNAATINETSPAIEVNYLEKVALNQEFSFKIKLINFDEDVYDVKIDILYNGNRISKILNGEVWKSTSYYVNDIINFDEEKEFLMKITEEFADATIEIKIKDSSEKIKIFQGYLISKSNETINETGGESVYQNVPENSEPNENGTIILTGSATANSKDIKSKENTEKLNKNNYAKYILIAFAFLIGGLFLLKKKIFKKEYKNEFQKQ